MTSEERLRTLACQVILLSDSAIGRLAIVQSSSDLEAAKNEAKVASEHIERASALASEAVQSLDRAAGL